ncbi:MAG: hypothetical protein NT004_06275 [Bacteroidetes bacterium]|nr:hypothetical protein [Bacteroidota bacterium]
MEQLTRINNDLQTKGRLIEVAMLMKKVEIRMSLEQFASLGRIMSSYLANIQLTDIDDKAIFYLLYQMYETKVRKKMFSMKQEIKFSLDMPQAWAVTVMMQEMDLSIWPYEYAVMELIVREIDHQTA